MRRLLVPSAALFWGLQFAFLNPALALLLVALYDAGPGDVGLALAAYNASGFLASLIVPAWADRTGDYLRPLLACAVLSLVLAGALAAATSFPLALVALIVVGGPSGVGISLLFAHQRHTGVSAATIVRTRAVFSVAWVAGPPLATFVVAGFGERGLLAALALVGVLNVGTALALVRPVAHHAGARTAPPPDDRLPLPRLAVVLLVLAFIALQATNVAAVSGTTLFVTRSLGLDVAWGGIALGVAAGLEIPALLLLGRFADRFPPLRLVVVGCGLGIGYYAMLPLIGGPVLLLAAQVLNAGFVAVLTGVGLTLFQRMIPRPGLATGLYTNTRRLGAIVAGGVLAVGGSTALGYAGVFVVCAVLTGVALLAVLVAGGVSRSAAA